MAELLSALISIETQVKLKLESVDAAAKKYFPYSSYRPFQKKAISFAYNVIKKCKIGLLSSPCGTGKSISVLTAYFVAAEEAPLGRLFALTRTRSQLEIYCRELKRVKEHSNINFTAAMFKSKKDMCPHVEDNLKLKESNYEDFLRYCNDLKKGVFGYECEYYNKTWHKWRPSWRALNAIAKIRETGPLLPDEVCSFCRDQTLCPYEITKILTRYADIIVGNYNYLLIQPIRQALLSIGRIRLDEINCILDEAHTLPRYAAGILSSELSSISIARARREVKKYGVEDFGVLEVLNEIAQKLGAEAYEYGLDQEHVIKRKEVLDTLVNNLELKNVHELLKLISKISDEGEKVRLARLEEEKSPVSYLSSCSSFLEEFVKLAGASYVNYVKTATNAEGKKYVKLGLKCLDPSLAASIINKLRSAILMSGTLWNMKYYIEVLGVRRDRVKSIELPNPFPSNNRLILVDKSVTTKYERRGEKQWRKIASDLGKVVDAIKGRIAVYFPSYEVMEAVSKYVKFSLPYFYEKHDTKISEVFNFLKLSARCIILGVAGGKISEGVDMSTGGRSLLSAVIIVGLPYPKKTELQNALLKYCNEKFGEKAFEYANDIPCANAIAQSAGRLLRSPDDRGIIAILDSRAAGKFKERLPREWRNEMKAYLKVEKLTERIQSFMNGNSKGSPV
jgi:DNA excision repair protein ERCC-2